jgi:hypothetical protein
MSPYEYMKIHNVICSPGVAEILKSHTWQQVSGDKWFCSTCGNVQLSIWSGRPVAETTRSRDLRVKANFRVRYRSDGTELTASPSIKSCYRYLMEEALS